MSKGGGDAASERKINDRHKGEQDNTHTRALYLSLTWFAGIIHNNGLRLEELLKVGLAVHDAFVRGIRIHPRVQRRGKERGEERREQLDQISNTHTKAMIK